jgi:hypothetical protein
MKTFLLIPLLLLTGCLEAQFNCGSWSDFDRILNFKSGIPYNTTFDGGLQWDQVGAFVGVRACIQYKKVKGKKIESGEPLIPFFKANANVISRTNFQVYFEGSVGRQFRSVDLKFAYSVLDDLSIILVPEYNNINREIDLGVSLRL